VSTGHFLNEITIEFKAATSATLSKMYVGNYEFDLSQVPKFDSDSFSQEVIAEATKNIFPSPSQKIESSIFSEKIIIPDKGELVFKSIEKRKYGFAILSEFTNSNLGDETQLRAYCYSIDSGGGISLADGFWNNKREELIVAGPGQTVDLRLGFSFSLPSETVEMTEVYLFCMGDFYRIINLEMEKVPFMQ
jgi:hypothetical protein